MTGSMVPLRTRRQQVYCLNRSQWKGPAHHLEPLLRNPQESRPAARMICPGTDHHQLAQLRTCLSQGRATEHGQGTENRQAATQDTDRQQRKVKSKKETTRNPNRPQLREVKG